jgi:hypothetical protein
MKAQIRVMRRKRKDRMINLTDCKKDIDLLEHWKTFLDYRDKIPKNVGPIDLSKYTKKDLDRGITKLKTEMEKRMKALCGK